MARSRTPTPESVRNETVTPPNQTITAHDPPRPARRTEHHSPSVRTLRTPARGRTRSVDTTAKDSGSPSARVKSPPLEFSVPQIPLPHFDLSMMSNNISAFPALEPPMSGNRQNNTPASSVTGQINGNGMTNANYMAPLPVGHQQDINYLYSVIQDLSGVLKANREQVTSLTQQCQDLAIRQTSGEASTDTDKAKLLELQAELKKKDFIIGLYKHEQVENTKLIADYEEGMGTATDQIREYCSTQNDRYLKLWRHYNELLQKEKDDHLQSRLERDEWHQKTLRCCEMIRTANRIRSDEWCDELKIIAALQAEVRIYRQCLGEDAEKPEEETGWPYLREVPLNLG